jgi:hypothetical protein
MWTPDQQRITPKSDVLRSIRGTALHHALAFKFVIPGLVPGIHVFRAAEGSKTWMAGTSPAMTTS